MEFCQDMRKIVSNALAFHTNEKNPVDDFKSIIF